MQQRVRSRVKALIRFLKRVAPQSTFNLHIVGHSLGGAIATIAAADLYLYLGPTAASMKVYTFGQPRVGNAAWAKWYNSLPFYNQSFRVTRFRDPVPRLPFVNFGLRDLENE